MGLLRRARSVRGRTQPRRLNYHCTYGHAYDSVPLLACGPCLGRGMRGVCAVSSDEGPCARHASRALRRACGQGAVLSLCMVRPGSGRFGVGFWVGFWVGLRARDFPTERVLSRTPLIIRTVDQKFALGATRVGSSSQLSQPPTTSPPSNRKFRTDLALGNRADRYISPMRIQNFRARWGFLYPAA